ncbi:arsenate reductase ArsC [Derxia lacustris]|uniref:arsenate reductase ArsC n=1 Tax=Derxia lacustris TaxID=764842 RepID=UPI000A175513|nr:arsenate reductase ArsC [Derxia lacustris]
MTTNVLILCTHNSARSILAEAMLNHLARLGGHDVRAYSAGSAPSGQVNPAALTVLAAAGVAIDGLSSKSWDSFTGPQAPAMQIVITVCANAAGETCPVWPGAPVQLHWGYPDPSRVIGDADRRAAFDLTRQALGYRLQQLLGLPLADMSTEALRAALLAIGRS